MANQDMINIAFVIDLMWGPNGGTEGQLLMLLKNIDKTKYRCHLVCLRNTEWLGDIYPEFSITMLNVGSLFHLGYIFKLLEFKRFCIDNRIDIVQTYFNDGNITGVLGGRLAGIKKIISCRRNLGPGFWKDRKILFIFRFLRRFTSLYLANSKATKESIVRSERIDREKARVIYNGLDLKKYEAIDDTYRRRAREKAGFAESEIVIGMVSHLRKDKNIELFLDGAAQVSREYSDLRFIILGEGPHRPFIEKKIEQLGIQKNIELVGAVKDVTSYLAAMDIACLTSNGESFSNAIIEYLAAGLPIIATDVGGNTEALAENGFLFPVGDLDNYLNLLTRLIDDKNLRVQTGIKGRAEAMAKYSMDKMVNAYESIYTEMMEKPGRFH